MKRKMTDEERRAAFIAKYVVEDSGCWTWTACRNHKGYGEFQSRRAHRFSYEIHVGPIPEGLQLDHLCRNRACVNPEHLEPVTNAENQRRGLVNQNKAKTCCPSCGGPYGLTFMSKRGTADRRCQPCFNAYKRRWRAERKLREQQVAA